MQCGLYLLLTWLGVKSCWKQPKFSVKIR